MTRWKKGAKEFEVILRRNRNRDGSLSMICCIPGPVVESLGNPDSLTFKLGKSRVFVEAGDK